MTIAELPLESSLGEPSEADSRQPTHLPFAQPHLSEEAIEEAVACLRSGQLCSGPRVERFETELRTYLGAEEVVAVSSGTAALHLALLGIGLEPGDEVITTPLTFVATTHAILRVGAVPIFVDVDPATRNLSLDQVERAITPRTRAILPVHFAGLPVDLDRLYGIAERHGLRIVEDAAHAIGAAWRGRRIGGQGDTQILSFHATKNLTTGEGGAVVTSDRSLADRVRTLRFHGIDRSDPDTWPYDVPEPGFKFNMMDLQAALGLHQIRTLDRAIERRRKLAERYITALADHSGIELPARGDESQTHAWHIFTVCLSPPDTEAPIDRRGFVERMAELGIGIGVHYPAVHLFRTYRERFGYQPGSFPSAERIGASIVTLPLFPELEESDVERVASGMRAVLA